MSYIGSSAAVVPVAFSGVNSESFNGDGSTVTFTLNRPVSSVKAIEVVVNNVQQSPYDGSYSVNDTTLTFSAAPSSGTANIYVTYLDFPVGSISTVTTDLTVNGLTVGRGAGAVSTNTAVGASALAANTTGSTNVAVGESALPANTSGADNTAVGRRAGQFNTTGSQNTMLGTQAMALNTTGNYNTSVGVSALQSNTTASYNTAVGYQAGYSNTTGATNVFVGRHSFYNNTTASNNTGLGHESGFSNTTGTSNTALGQQALRSNTVGSRNTAVGYQAGYNHTYYDATFIGYLSGFSNTSGAENTSVGHTALYANTSGSNNTAMGKEALYANTTGTKNTSIGNLALYSNTTASYNTAVGYQAGYNTTTGYRNVFVGEYSGWTNTTGSWNTFVGHYSGQLMTTGSGNTIIGRYDGNQGGLDIRTASNYIVLSDGDGNPRGYFDNSGYFYAGQTNGTTKAWDQTGNYSYAHIGGNFIPFAVTNYQQIVGVFNRAGNDGTLVEFKQDAVVEGSISVSGTTVSYNGGHLSRWAQTTTAKDESLLKGTVLSNLDEMNVYTDADGNPVDNEQLNKVKVSDVEGDSNVAGVFVNWDFDEAHNVDEINMAMTGDMIIRIAQGTTVQRGDLLMSAGDGTAKPQGDDIVRSKTIAKVTSTHVTCTYADGSYCVPCVLMAC